MSAITSHTPLEAVDVRSVMASGLVSCPPCAALSEAAVLMSIHQVHAVIVDPGAPRLVTAPEVLRAILADAASVGDIAAAPAPSIAPAASLQAAAEEMVRRQEGHLVVREHAEGRALGMVSSFDVVAALAGHDPRLARIVRPAPARPALSGALTTHAVRDVMHRGLVSCPPSATLAEVAMALTERRTHTALVALESGLAFVTDMSIVTAAARGDGDALAGELVTSGLARVRADATLDVAAAFVAESPVGHVVAVDVDGFPVGVVSTLDLLGAVDPS